MRRSYFSMWHAEYIQAYCRDEKCQLHRVYIVDMSKQCPWCVDSVMAIVTGSGAENGIKKQSSSPG